MADRLAASLVDAFERALAGIRTRVSASALAVAYSGGLDSAALLHLARDYAIRHGLTLFAFHIHHGISPNADDWLLHCARECERLGINFEARRVSLTECDRHGVEQAARHKRYGALGELCRARGIHLLLTAHHQDDQAETVLLQMLRGSGVAGLSGMATLSAVPDMSVDSGMMIGRPLLDVTREELERFIEQQKIPYVEDESNADFRYARNALRHNVMPSLARFFPGFQERLARTAQHAQAAQRLLSDLGAQDLEACVEEGGIVIARLNQLSSDRIDNMLRYWFASHGVRMPSTAWLSEMCGQLLGAREDAQPRVTHAECEIRRHRGKIFLTPRRNGEPNVPPATFRWRGEERIHLPAFGGSLCFDESELGVDAGWLREQELQVRHRSGGEKLKLAPNRPTKSLKHHYQALSIPAWDRPHLPVVTAGDRLLYAAGIGMNWCEPPCVGNGAICLRWEGDAA